jgi:hypothetical protein
MVAGFALSDLINSKYLSQHPRWRKLLLFPGIFVGLITLDGYPLQEVPMAAVQPAYSDLRRELGPCGAGMAFPFYSPFVNEASSYVFTQRMRGSDCAVLNLAANTNRIAFLTKKFPPDLAFLNSLQTASGGEKVAFDLERIARCVPLTWIVFDHAVSPTWAGKFCDRLGWKMTAEFVCIAPDRTRQLVNYPEKCL